MMHSHGQSNFSMYFSMAPQNHNHYGHRSYDEEINYNNNTQISSLNSSSSVDCTLSLGTPSTRLSEGDEKRRRSACIPNFFWDTLQSKNAPFNHQTQTQTASYKSTSSRNGGSSSSSTSVNHDSLLARRCANCDTTSTPLWRNGPRGPKSLCNACGIRFKKEERRATAANANSGNSSAVVASSAEHHHHHHHHNSSSWVQAQKMNCYNNNTNSYGYNELRFMEADYSNNNQSDRDNNNNFLSWRLNVTDNNRPTSLVHDFTR